MTIRRAAAAIAACVVGLVGSDAARRAGGGDAGRPAASFQAVAADVFWIRAVQSAGRDRHAPAGRFERLASMLDASTSFDPQFGGAYRIGAVLLAEPPPAGPGRPDQAMALLRKGLRNTPSRWQYAFDIGFIAYWYGAGSGQRETGCRLAADWFERAAGLTGAPAWLGPLAATMRTESGDREGARRLLAALASSDEAWIRQLAEQRLSRLSAPDVTTYGAPFASPASRVNQ